ncbi:unnamed protein product [Brassica oleracea]
MRFSLPQGGLHVIAGVNRLTFLLSKSSSQSKKKKGTTMNYEQNNSTSFPPTEPELCDNRCGFFVSSNMNLCSKCYRILRAEEDLTAVAKSAVKNSLRLPSCSLIITPQQKQPLETEPASVVVTAEPSSAPIGVMGFKCKCGSTFCRSHRCPEKHECSFNFKKVGLNYNQYILTLLWCCLYKREEIPH